MKRLVTSIALFLFLPALPIFAQENFPTSVIKNLPPEITREIENELTVNPPEDFRLSASLRQDRNADLDQWEPTDSTEYYYDENGNLIELLYRKINSDDWPLRGHTLNTYDENHQLIYSVDESWNGTEWFNENGQSRTIQEYNDNGDILLYHVQLWEDGTWQDNTKITYEYDPVTGYLVSKTGQLESFEEFDNYDRYHYLEYDNAGNNLVYVRDIWLNGEWVPNRKYTFEYNINNQTTHLLSQTPNGTEWVDDTEVFYFPNNESQVDSSVHYRWNTTYQSWLPYQKFIFNSNSNGDRTSQLRLDWNLATNNWINARYSLKEYDANFNETKYLLQQWNTSLNDWDNMFQNVYTYDENDNRKTTEVQVWSNDLNVWDRITHFTYYYETLVSTSDLHLSDNSIQIYPNPSSGLIELWFAEEMTAETKIDIKVLNLTGQTLLQFNRQKSNEPLQLDLQALRPGTYLLQLRQADKIMTKKIMITR